MAIFLQGGTAHLTQSVSLSMGGEEKMSFWFNPRGTLFSGTAMSYFDNSGGVDYSLVRVNSNGSVHLEYFDGLALASTTSVTGLISTNTWFHIMAEWKSDTDKRLYLDGVQVGSTITTSVSPTGFDTIQLAALFGGTRLSGGAYADVSVIGGTFAAGDFKALADGFCPHFLATTEVSSYSRFVCDQITLNTQALYDEITGGTWVVTGNGRNPDIHPPIIYPSNMH